MFRRPWSTVGVSIRSLNGRRFTHKLPLDSASRENQIVTSFFVVICNEVRIMRNEKPYLSLTLPDKTGSIEAKMWDNIPSVAELCHRDEFVKLRGRINTFNGRYEITLERLRRAPESEIDLSDFLPRPPGMWKRCGMNLSSSWPRSGT